VFKKNRFKRVAGRDMKLMSYNTNGRLVNIGIAGDHQMTVKRLGAFCAVINTQLGRLLGIFHQYTHVPEQAKSIHSICQFQAHGNLVGDTATRTHDETIRQFSAVPHDAVNEF
jgi:hypothetical protein